MKQLDKLGGWRRSLLSALILAVLSIVALGIIGENQQSTGEVASIGEETRARFHLWSEELRDWTFSDQESNRDLHESSCVWPEDCQGDRIINQLKLKRQADEVFKIFPPDYSYPIEADAFRHEGCLVDRCTYTYNQSEADALIFPNSDVRLEPPKERRKDQVWIAYLLESPRHTYDSRFARSYRGVHQFNWTATYRSDSDIVAPYSKFVPYAERLDDYISLRLAASNSHINLTHEVKFYGRHKYLISQKHGKVAWFVSNCHAANNRLEYAKELSKHIQVDIYGKCGNLTCTRSNQTYCLELVNRKYKFYLAFENSNCEQYITEKLFRNAYNYNDLNHLLLPIVMGPDRSDYEASVPAKSFIHVNDFKSARDLAEYLKLLDSNDELYYSYFLWKTMGRFAETKFMCRVCAMLHESRLTGKMKTYKDIKSWWSRGAKGERVCRD